LRLVGQRTAGSSPFHTLEDLRAIVREASQQGMAGMAVLQGALDLHDREVREVMTPRHETATVRRGQSLEDALAVARASRHSRLPVLGASHDDVAGIVESRGLYEARARGPHEDWAAAVRPPRFVPWTQPVSTLLPALQRERCQMAIALDEHGAFRGLVTIADLLEVIVGDITDEHERLASPRGRLPEGGSDVDASIPVKSLNADYGLDLPESPNYVTLAGLILERLGVVPRRGQSVEVPPYSIRVLDTDGPRVQRAHVALAARAAETSAASERPEGKG
jgi:magnesium and cobalt transporter